jgi:hypothetical protein
MWKFKFTITIILLAFTYQSIFAGNEDYPLGARQAGMGTAGVAFHDLWSVTHNQAGLALLTKPSFGLFYENKFALKELGLKAGAFAYPTSSGVFAIDLMQFGYSKYNESRIGLAYAKSLGKKFSIGVKFDYLNTFYAEGYGNKGTFIAEIGFLAQPIKHFFIGGHIYNLSRSKIAAYDDERVPSIITFGIAYEFSEKVLCTVEAEKDLQYKPIYKVGMEYKFLENLFIRAGVTSNPNQMSLGIGYIYKKIKADISFSSHQVLGISPHIGISYEFGKNSTNRLTN